MGKVNKNQKTDRVLDKSLLRNRVKCIRMVKSDKTGAYSFKTEVVHTQDVKEFFSNNN